MWKSIKFIILTISILLIFTKSYAADYYVLINNQQQGPVSMEQLQQMNNNGDVTKDTLVWKKGMANWEKAGRQSDLQTLFKEFIPSQQKKSDLLNFVNINNSPNIFEATGGAECKCESILNALVNMQSLIAKKIFNSNYDSLINRAFGRISITNATEISEIDDISSKTLSTIKSRSELKYNNGIKQFRISKTTLKKKTKRLNEEQVIETKHQFSISKNNCTLSDLINELKNIGCQFEYFIEDEAIFTKIRYNKKRLLENMAN